MKTILALLLSALPLFAQTPFADVTLSQPVVAVNVPSGWNPDAIPGYPSYVSYDAEGGHFTASSGFAVWTNLMTANAGLDLTNRSSGTARQPAIVADALNSTNDYLNFPVGTGGTYLKSDNYVTWQPSELWFVAAVTNNQTWRMMTTGKAATGGQSVNRNGSGIWQISSPTAVNDVNIPLERWMFLRVVFNGTSSSIYTNNVLVKTGDAGTGGGTGLVVNIYYDLSQYSGTMKLARLISYRTNLTTAYATSNYYYFTNRYGPPE